MPVAIQNLLYFSLFFSVNDDWVQKEARISLRDGVIRNSSELNYWEY